MESKPFIVFYLCLRSIVDDKVRFKVLKLFFCRTDKHIGNEMCLPSDLDDEADSHARVLICTAERIDDKKTLV